LNLRGALNKAALEQSLNAMIKRHEILRTCFPERNGMPVQQIMPELQLGIQEIDLKHVPENRREIEARKLAAEEFQRPFDLEKGPLLRIQLLCFGEQDHVLLVTMHHMVSDEWSLGLTINEVSHLYEAFANGIQPRLPELEFQYGDFAIWQQRWIEQEVLDKQLEYWKDHLKGISALELPFDYPRRPAISHPAGSVPFRIDQALAESLKQLSRSHGVTLFMTLLAAYQVLLHKYTGQADIAVGSPIANRNHSAAQKLIGFLANMVVLRTDFRGSPTFVEVLGRVREITLSAFDHQDLPFEMLVEAMQPDRTFGHPLVQAVLSMRTAEREKLELSGLRLSQLEYLLDSKAKFDLLLIMADAGYDLLGKWEYNASLFEAETIRGISRHFVQLLRRLVDQPQESISSVELLSDEELEGLRGLQDADEMVSGSFGF